MLGIIGENNVPHTYILKQMAFSPDASLLYTLHYYLFVQRRNYVICIVTIQFYDLEGKIYSKTCISYYENLTEGGLTVI
jgi:hypothetical protein